MPWSSNGTFLVHACSSAGEVLGVYKPERGERPAVGLPARALAPRDRRLRAGARPSAGTPCPSPSPAPTGRSGPGSVQLFVPFDPDAHYFTLFEDEANHPQLRRFAVFDIVANSTDRKSGHVLRGPDQRIWAIDNGLAFHEEFKLRTVIWEFGGDVIESELVEPVEALLEPACPTSWRCCSSNDEQDALRGPGAERGHQPPVPRRRHRSPLPLAPRLNPIAPFGEAGETRASSSTSASRLAAPPPAAAACRPVVGRGGAPGHLPHGVAHATGDSGDGGWVAGNAPALPPDQYVTS